MKDPPQVPLGLTNVEQVLNLARREDWTDGDAHLAKAWESVLAGKVRPAEDLIAELRARR